MMQVRRMAWVVAVCAVLLPAAVRGEKAAQDAVVVGYVFPQNKVLAEGEIAAEKLTRVNYAFANIEGGRIVNGFAHDDENLAALVALKKGNPQLTVLVSVGGWLWSGGFSEMALTRESRAMFVESVAAYVRAHELDGLDIDWEYPGLPGATKNFRAEDKQNYTLLVKELRKRFDGLERELGRKLYVTVATGSGEDFLAHTEMREVARYVDTVNLMAYDYYEPGAEGMTGHHAPLHRSGADPKGFSAERSVEEYEQAGVPAGKIVLGVPFYGHVWGEVAAGNHGLYQAGKELPKGTPELGARPEAMVQDGFVRYWDEEAKAPYLYHAGKQMFVSYEDAESLELKCRFVMEKGLRGVMFWDYESDPSGVLLETVHTGLKRGGEEKSVTR